MRDGVVMGCWRNAPENPRPKLPSKDSDKIPLKDRAWLHQKLRDGLIPGGGNELWIKHDDGSDALYAHAKTGSIPASPVPDNAMLLDGSTRPAIRRP